MCMRRSNSSSPNTHVPEYRELITIGRIQILVDFVLLVMIPDFHGLKERDCWIGRVTEQYLDSASDTVVGETMPWLMGDVIMPYSSGREFYTAWFHIDKVFFYLWYKIVWSYLVGLTLIFFFLIIGRMWFLDVWIRKPENKNCHNWNTFIYSLEDVWNENLQVLSWDAVNCLP